MKNKKKINIWYVMIAVVVLALILKGYLPQFMGAAVPLAENCKSAEPLQYTALLEFMENKTNFNCTDVVTDPPSCFKNVEAGGVKEWVIHRSDNETIGYTIFQMPTTYLGIIYSSCTDYIRAVYLDKGTEPATIIKDGRTLYVFDNATWVDAAQYIWCTQYDNIMVSTSQNILNNYWSDLITCTAQVQTVTVACWHNSTTNNVTTCDPQTKEIPKINMTGYCTGTNEYYTELECEGLATGLQGPTGPAGPQGPAGQAGKAFSTDIETFFADNWFFIFVGIIGLIAYIIWEKGPKRGFIQQ